jgi:EAL domain-containing protein (putative c-di-GMP-specific phosphodiesterase class I)
MTIIKYLFYILALYFILLFTTFSLTFVDLKNKIIAKHNAIINLQIRNFELKAKANILHNNYDALLKDMIQLKEYNGLNYLNIKYLDYYFSVNSILSHSNNIKTKDWILSDISIDSKYGYLEKFNDTIYKFHPEEDYEFSTPVEIKFQALNDEDMQNSISIIKYKLPNINIIVNNDMNDIQLYLNSFINLELLNKTTILYLPNTQKKFAQINYLINNDNIYNDIYISAKNIFILISIIYFLILLIIMGTNYYLHRIMVVKHLKSLNTYTNDVLTNKFYRYDAKALKQKDIIELAQIISKVSKKTSAIINELNINKSTLELQISLDQLTKLPNTKIFENDMKSLFLTNIKSYITLIKLECLKDFSKSHPQNITDQLIFDFVSIVKESVKLLNNKHTKIYRIYGSEFMIISKYADFELMHKIITSIVNSSQLLKESYEISNKILFASSLPFDHYSTTENILKTLEETFNTRNDTNYIIQKEKQVEEKDLILENNITSIISNNAFSLSYKYDTYLLSDPNVLIMQEVSPNLIDKEGNNIPIGTFIAVAEHRDLALEFDKLLIIKAFKYIKKMNIDHQLAINISISSIKDESFINWLEAQILYDYKDVIDKVVFSITTFAATNNFDEFVRFSSEMSKFNGKILLKRFSYNDLTLEQLESLHLSYIRVHKDYTNNINEQRKSVLKNIVNFSVIHDIHVLGDMVSDKTDYQTIKELKFHATSK